MKIDLNGLLHETDRYLTTCKKNQAGTWPATRHKSHDITENYRQV